MRQDVARVVASLCLACLPLGACRPKDDEDDAVPPASDQATDAGTPTPFQGDRDFAGAGGALTNLRDITQSLGLAPVHAAGFRGQDLTIAVLDNGFLGLSESLGERLPPGLTVADSPLGREAETVHGTKMAEIAYAVASGRASYSPNVPGPRLLLLNTNGFTNFKAAVDRVIAERADIVLYSQVWEYGGNGDGTGFINVEVDRAVRAGVLWINAAGNLGDSTWSGPVTIADEASGVVSLPFEGRYVRFVVPADGTPVKIVLAWNDFRSSKDYRTTEDLDLVVEDEHGREVAAARLKQSGEEGAGSDEGTSAHAREIVQTMLPAGTFRLRVEARSRNFDTSSRLHLTIDGNRVVMLDKTSDDSLMIPADNKGVIAVGAADARESARNPKLSKPEIAVRSRVAFAGGISHTSTSSAAAIVAGALAAFRTAYGRADRTDIMNLVTAQSLSVSGAGCASGGETCPPLLKIDASTLRGIEPRR